MVKMIYLVSVIVVLVIVSATGIILWGDEVSEVFNFQDDSSEFEGFDVEIDGRESGGSSSGGGSAGDSAGGSGGGSVGGLGSDGSSVGEDCNLEQVPYSLKNFEESVACQEYAGEDCIDLSVDCSVEIYNLDDDFSGDFEIRYALLNESSDELDAKTLKGNVGFGEDELFVLSFSRGDVWGVSEDLSCSFSMIDVPKKEVCS